MLITLHQLIQSRNSSFFAYMRGKWKAHKKKLENDKSLADRQAWFKESAEDFKSELHESVEVIVRSRRSY